VVVGSVHQDYLVRVPRRPEAGETVTGAELTVSGGGKGANQAAAAARRGAPTALVARVGDDPSGRVAVAELAASGVDTRWIRPTAGTPTGSAFITVTADGENQIIVASGANARLDDRDVAAAYPAIAGARVLLAQLEIPPAAVAEAVRTAPSATTVVLNAAPAAPLAPEVLERIDVLVVNQHEAADLLASPPAAPDAMAVALRALGPAAVVVTCGAAGTVLATGDGTWSEPAPPTEVVDTTGAGDVFAGTLAAALAQAGARRLRPAVLVAAVAEAVVAASESVTRIGARDTALDKGPART
jgi:ribokinase